MPLINYIKVRVAPTWQALTDAQHSAWHFFAVANPIINDQGQLDTVNGWMMFVHVNSWLSIAGTSFMLSDPPADLARPEPINLTCSVWPIKLQLPDTTTFRNGRVFVDVSPALPSNRLVIIVQPAKFVSVFSVHPWPVPHSSFIAPSFSGLHDLTVRNGLSGAGSAGLYKLRISGPWVKGHPGEKAAKLIAVSTDNGMRNEGALTNSKG